MSETNATILIPDISGFTEFMTTTELSHGTRAINMLIESIVNAIGEEYEVSEIEGDAVLLIKKGPAPSRQEILDSCMKIFNGFHFQRKWMQQFTLCPCGACRAISDLTIKFVVHHGPLMEFKVGRFVKQSGTEMIIAHRLLKNSISNNEYLLITEKLLENSADTPDGITSSWSSSSEQYSSIGQVDYRFILLNEARKNVPDPPMPPTAYQADNTPFHEVHIDANYMDVYMQMMNIPARAAWMEGLQRVEQDMPEVFVGTQHVCVFDDFTATISPLRMSLDGENIIYAELCRIEQMNVGIVHESVFKPLDQHSCLVSMRILPWDEKDIPQEVYADVVARMHVMGARLKSFCEKK